MPAGRKLHEPHHPKHQRIKTRCAPSQEVTRDRHRHRSKGHTGMAQPDQTQGITNETKPATPRAWEFTQDRRRHQNQAQPRTDQNQIQDHAPQGGQTPTRATYFDTQAATIPGSKQARTWQERMNPTQNNRGRFRSAHNQASLAILDG